MQSQRNEGHLITIVTIPVFLTNISSDKVLEKVLENGLLLHLWNHLISFDVKAYEP